MSDTSATIIAASLSSEELENSIDKLVGNVATATDLIRKDFDDMANHIKQSLNSLGNIKIDSGGTADGGSSRRTSKQKEEETQVKATTQAYKEQKTVVGELAMSFDNLNTAITKSNSKLAAKFDVTEQQKVQQLEAQRTAIEDKIVARQIEIDESYRSQLATLSKTRSELESKANLTSKEQADLKHVTTEWERINRIVRDISSRPIVAADDPTGSIGRLQQQLVDTNRQLDESRKRIQEMNFERAKMYDGSLSSLVQNAQATMKYQNDTLKKSFEDLLKKPTHDVDEMRAKMERLQTFLNNIKPLNIFSPELIANGERAINKLKNEIQKFNDKPTKQAFADAIKLPDRTQSEIITKINRIRDAIKNVEGTKIISETEIARAKSLIDSLRDKWSKLYNAPRDRQLRIDFADALKMPTNNIDEIAAKLMRLQYILQEMRGMEVLSPQQIANGNQQISALLSKLEAEMSLRQQINAVEQADMQNAQKRIELEAKYGEEVAKAAAIANDWLQKNKEAAILNKEGTFVIQDPKAGQTVGQSIESQLLAYKAINGELNLELEVQKAIQNTVELIERAEQRRIALVQGGNAASNKSFADYEDLRTAIAAVLRVRESEVSLANSEDASYKALSLTLKQLKQAYESLDASQRKSENADALIASIHETQRAMQEIQKQMSRPVRMESILALPEKSLDEITYKIQMFRAYMQGLNSDDEFYRRGITLSSDAIEHLTEKAKNLQKTTKQTAIEANNIKFDNIAKMPAEGLKQVGEKIKEVKQYINELKNQPIVDEKNLKRAEALYDRLIKQSQKLNETKGTHSNVNDALNVRVKTLDDIAKKMQRLQAIRKNLDINKQKADIDRINAALGELKKQQDGVLQRNANMIKSNNALGRSWNYMKNRLAFYFTVGASTQFIKNLIEVRSQYEMNERALGILINSAERGTQIFNELSQMALVSPYTLIELSNAAKQLTAYDIAAKDVVETTRRLADMASAVGVPMERLTYALGQIKAYGYLNSRDARMFANAGIPLVRELSKYYSELEGKVVSVGDVYDRMKKKAIDFNSVMAVVTKMTDEGGKFFDFQAKMANTLKVQLANLTLAWNNMLNDLGASQQGVLVGGIAALKNLFLHWQDIYDIITKVAYAFGLYKLAQATTLIWTGRITTAMGMQELVGKKLQARLAGLTAANKSFVAASTVGWMALAAVVVEVLYTWHKNVEEIEHLNKTIADGAKESAKALDEFINSAEMSYARLSAQNGKLPKSEAEKTWEALREQIEISSASADQIIPKLLEIGDLNQRLTIAFGLAERIKDANNKLGDLENELDVSQDSILGGLLGEGLIEDIEDYNEHLAYSAEKAEYFTKKNHGFWENAAMGLKALYNEVRDSMGSSTDEAEKEITNFARNAAQTIKDELGEEGLKDKIQVNEAIARVVSGVEQMFPKLRGKGKMLFETMFNDVMAQEFNGAVDKQAYYYKLFLERLKKDHGSAFQGVTDDILKETHKWSTGQQNAINKTAEKVKKDLPLAAQDAIDQILRQLNKTDFKLRIVTEFATTTLDDVQKQFKDKFISKPWIADQKEREKAETEAQQRYGNLMRKTTESNVEYEKRVSDERKKQLELSQKNAEIIAANKNNQDALSKAIVKDAQEQKKASDDWLKAAKDVEDIGGYDFSTKKENTAASKAQKAAETELQKALKDELQLIDKVRSQYKKLTDAGATDGEALAMVTNQFANSLAHVNNVLGKNGIPLFNISKFAGTDNPQALLDMLKLQLDSAKIAKNIKPEEIKELEVKYSEIVVDAKAYNLTKITKGLNNELDKLKDEYELSLELDANPELGDMFADMFGIDTNTLPQTFGEALDRAQDIINRKLSDLNIASPFDIMQSDVNEFANSSGLEKESEAIKELAKWQNTFRDMFKKNILDSEKMLDDYVKKYGGYSDKIAEIEADRLEKIKKLNDAYYTEEMRQRPEYIAKMNAINQGASREKSNVEFDAFKNSRYYTMMFENLDYISTKTIRDMRDRLRELMDSMNDLTPEQLKQVMTQYEKLEQKLVKRSPFKTLTKDLKNYLKTSGDRKAANEAFRNAQKEYDAQEKKVAALKENYKLLLTSSVITKEGLETAEQEITAQDKILVKLKEQLEIAEKKADKYNLIKKLALEELSQTATMVSANLKGLAELRDQMNELFGVDASKGETLLGHKIDGMIDGLAKASDGISKVTSSAQSGNVFGVVGGVVDVFTGIGDAIASAFGGGSAKTKRLNREINESKEVVRQLSMAYDDLERAVSKSLGTAETEARRAAIANKELQLSELERQKTLEESKRSKDRDDDAIKQYEEAIHSLRNEIDDLKEDVINNLWGEDVKSAAEAFVDAWVQAWRAGETTLDAIKEKMDEMIYNLIKKAMTSKIVETLLNPIYDELNKMTKEGSEGGVALTTNELRQLAQQAGITAEQINVALGEFYGNLERLGIVSKTDGESNELSALQQGIQGITEDTAGALEAYMNGVSQQVYYQSDLLTQIRDAVVGFDLDVQVATMGQILLQLQASYTVQMSIQGILDGWNNPSGQAVRVELIS